jgi:ABC-type multidrug transport system permease subunit
MEVVFGLMFLNSLHITMSGFWPVEAVTKWFRFVVYLVPNTLPGEALRSILLRGWGLEHFRVWIGFGITFLYSFIAIWLSHWIIRRRK